MTETTQHDDDDEIISGELTVRHSNPVKEGIVDVISGRSIFRFLGNRSTESITNAHIAKVINMIGGMAKAVETSQRK